MSDDFLNELVDEIREVYNPPPDVPVEALWRAVRERRAIRDAYNAPGVTPRDAIWAGVQARRATAPVGAAADASEIPSPTLVPVTAPDGRADPWPARQPSRADTAAARVAALSRYRWVGWAAPIAATLLVGIAIGRSVPGAPAVTGPASEEAAASGSAVADGQTGDSTPSSSPTGTAESLQGRLAVDDPAGGDRTGDDATPRGDEAQAAPSPLRVEPVTTRGQPATSRGETVAARAGQPTQREGTGRETLFRVAAIETLGGAEALLGNLEASSVGNARASSPVATWGLEMLSQTRLLLDSPAADDPALRVLLEDLEVVLVQLVRFGEGPMVESDAEFLEDAVRGRQILTRIRALLPGEATARGT